MIDGMICSIKRKNRLVARKNFDVLLGDLPGAVYRCQLEASWPMQFIGEGISDLLGHPPEYFTSPPPDAKAFGHFIHEDDQQRVFKEVSEAICKLQSYRLVYRLVSESGAIKWVSEQGKGILDGAGNVIALEGYIVDITRLKQSSDLAMEQASMLDYAHDAIFVTDHLHQITYWNKSAEKLYGWTAEQALGKNCCDMVFCDRVEFDKAMQVIATDGEWSGDIEQRTSTDTRIFVSGRYTKTDNEYGNCAKLLFMNSDVTQQREAQEKIHRLAFYDVLTNLPNRAYFMERLHRTLAAYNRHAHFGTLMFMDLDNFKILNDTCGHAKGDILLAKVARNLESCLRENDFVARLGGDEFVILLENEATNDVDVAFDSAVIAQKVLTAVSKPVDLGGGLVHQVSASIGVTFFQAGKADADEILKQADMAMYQAKLHGRNQACYFDEDMHQATMERMDLEREFARGLEYGELMLHYQPQINQQGEIVGVEALIRWNHPQRGLLMPDDFLALIEPQHHDAGLCHWVLHATCRQLIEWSDMPAMKNLFVSINLSAQKFKSPDFPAFVEAVLRNTKVNPALLRLELPEAVFAFDVDAAASKMHHLKEYGVRFTLDNFGTATSSLSILNQLPFDELKIDRSFVSRIDEPFNNAMVRSMLSIGHAIGITVVAEGVETAEQQAILMAADCRHFQGNYFYPPMRADHLEIVCHDQFTHDFGISL